MRRFLVGIAVCAVMPAAATAATSVSGKFKGTTSQGQQVKIKIATGRLEHSTLKWSATCTSQGRTLTGTTVLTGSLENKHYKHREVYTVSVKHGLKAKHTANAQFTVKGHRLKGSFTLAAVVFSAPGHVTTTCSTSKITFSAKS